MKQTNNIPTSMSAKISAIKRISPFWLLPFIAFCVGIVLFYQIHQEQGEKITIFFSDGSGLIAEKTPIRYQGLQIGLVKKVNFTQDMKSVKVEANIYPEAVSVLREDTKFWIVQPSASLAGVSGLDALVSGNYITLSPGKGEEADTFVAEDRGPIAELSEGDLLIHLIADDLGSIELGSSIFFRKVPVGKVNNYSFTDDKKVAIDIIIYKQYAKFVKKESRFWNISGIKADANWNGISVSMDSIQAILQGAIAFDSPDESDEAQGETTFPLYSSIKAAKRGLNVNITLPNDISGLKENDTPVYFHDLQVGVLSEINYGDDEDVINSTPTIQAKLLVDPSIKSNLKSGSKIVLMDRPSLAEVSNLNQFLQGKYFEIIDGNGTPTSHFEVIKQSELLLQQPGALILSLTSPQTYGIEEGQPISYNGIKIGEIVSRQVEIDKTTFKAVILAAYRHLINAETLFVAASNFSLDVSSDGVQMNVESPRKWLQGGINVLLRSNKTGGKALRQYPLYANNSNALAGITSDSIKPTIVLTTTELPNISENSLVLYRRLPVGKILSIRPNKQSFDIAVFINQQYQYLFTKQSRFWAENAIQVDISLQGVDIKAAPFSRILKGAISFDNIGQNGTQTILYPNQTAALSVGHEIMLFVDNADNLTIGMPLRYLGLEVGTIQKISLDEQKQKVIALASIQRDYFNALSKKGSHFTLVTPQLSAGGVQNLDALLKPYINVNFGQGKTQTQFTLSRTSGENNKYQNGFPLVLETENAASLSIGAPVLYRGVEVGAINNIKLNTTSDRVFVDIQLAQQYRHLVRQNSEFWLASGYSLDIGWSGVDFQTGTAQQLLRGGIAFSTPSGKIVQPVAKAYQHFLLQTKKPAESQNWNQGSAPQN
ncbi:PqiB family protein [Gallibacterium genomosp. 1]|uniref:Mce/MlaD domain-containing protein n=1 Tax=Gallibacterium genomosp. 1 TaxID=155515 RepID=A0AB36DW43_9PAST|nr:MlaD family protein [Gallibacterium genomosp. 1]OBX00802.1 hypothetical protein QV04_06100 [Gallibacterium genomosp. 1]OBX01179.1 hypothetical protein QV05_06400 [Gallibacterium genomosp. 1]